MSRLELKIPPPLVGLLCASLMYGIDLIYPQQWLAPPLALAGGVLLAMAGIAIDLISVWQFRRVRTTINPLKPQSSSALVTHGIYGYSRNPMYLGMLMILCGWALYLGNLLALPCLPLFVAYLTRFQIVPEERVMASLFGTPFVDYCQRVRRWC